MEPNNEMTNKQRRIAVILFLLVFMMMCMVIVGIPRDLKRWVYSNNVNDKITHIFFGSTFTFFASAILYPRKLRIFSIDIHLGAVIMGILFTLDEISQIPLPGRDANPLDLAASLFGLLIGYVAFQLMMARRRKRERQTSPPVKASSPPPRALP
ncbi:MAG: hypothetical protein AAGU05_05215 [Anaerolineaceae bacterium]